MNKIIYNKFDKRKIPDLPRALFPGRIVTILSADEAEGAVDFLLGCDILGFDTETRPIFRKGHQREVALLQVSTHDICFLFRLNRIGLCPAIKRLLESEGPKKIGLSWHDDVRVLHRRGDFEPRGFFDLQDHMGELGIEDKSLAKLFANIFNQRISKREQLSNWEADVLTQKQKDYAATDAWACVVLYEEYCRLKENQDFLLEIVPEPEPEPVVTEVKEETAAVPEEKKKAENSKKTDSKKRTVRKKTHVVRKKNEKKEHDGE